jgi:integral membrane protein (TIGR01906 family)
MKTLGTSAKWLFMLCLPVLLITASLGWVASSLWLYKYGFEKYDISQATGLDTSELEKTARGLIGYFNSDEEYISLTVVKDGEPFELFNEREVIHLKDVKGLIQLDYGVGLGTLAYVLAYAGVCLFWKKRRYWRDLAWGLVGGGGITLGLMLALGLGILFGFEQIFWQFHVISFSNQFWLLDPTRDYLKMLFPDGFFYDATILIAVITAALAIILGGVGGGYLRYLRSAKRTSG